MPNEVLRINESRPIARTADLYANEEQSHRQSIKWLLLQGENGDEALWSRKKSGKIQTGDIFSAGVELLNDGHITIGDYDSPLQLAQAASVMHTLTSRAWNGNATHGRHLSMIARHSEKSNRHRFYRFDPDVTLREARVDELETRVIDLLTKGKLNLFPGDSHRGLKIRGASLYDRSIGLGFVNALAQIPEFRNHVRDWLGEVIKISTTDRASIPHFFSYFMEAFNLYHPQAIEIMDRIGGGNLSDSEGAISYPIIQQTYKNIESVYSKPESKKRIEELIALSRVNTGTGDTYAGLDAHTLPIIGNLFGSNARWLELAISRGVVWNGTLKRAKKIGIHPTWMLADIYHPKELWKAGFKYYKIANSEDPFTLTNGASADPTQARDELKQIFKDNNYRGFIRANFESSNFTPNVLKKWRQRNDRPYPQVIRMTGVFGVTVQSMKNLLSTVDPKGGVIIFSEGNSLDLPRNTMWRVYRNPNKTRVELLHSGEDT